MDMRLDWEWQQRNINLSLILICPSNIIVINNDALSIVERLKPIFLPTSCTVGIFPPPPPKKRVFFRCHVRLIVNTTFTLHPPRYLIDYTNSQRAAGQKKNWNRHGSILKLCTGSAQRRRFRWLEQWLGDDFRWSCARSWDSLCHGNPWILEEPGWFWAWGWWTKLCSKWDGFQVDQLVRPDFAHEEYQVLSCHSESEGVNDCQEHVVFWILVVFENMIQLLKGRNTWEEIKGPRVGWVTLEINGTYTT